MENWLQAIKKFKTHWNNKTSLQISTFFSLSHSIFVFFLSLKEWICTSQLWAGEFPHLEGNVVKLSAVADGRSAGINQPGGRSGSGGQTFPRPPAARRRLGAPGAPLAPYCLLPGHGSDSSTPRNQDKKCEKKRKGTKCDSDRELRWGDRSKVHLRVKIMTWPTGAQKVTGGGDSCCPRSCSRISWKPRWDRVNSSSSPRVASLRRHGARTGENPPPNGNTAINDTYLFDFSSSITAELKYNNQPPAPSCTRSQFLSVFHLNRKPHIFWLEGQRWHQEAQAAEGPLLPVLHEAFGLKHKVIYRVN